MLKVQSGQALFSRGSQGGRRLQSASQCNHLSRRLTLTPGSPLSLLRSPPPAVGRTISRPRPSLGPRPHPGSPWVGSGAILESTVWAPTANPSRLGLSVQTPPQLHPALLSNLISYRCQGLSSVLGRTADAGPVDVGSSPLGTSCQPWHFISAGLLPVSSAWGLCQVHRCIPSAWNSVWHAVSPH